MAAREDFAVFVAASSRQLLRAAWLLTGDWAAAEDLTQAAYEAMWARWERAPVEYPDAYVRRVMVTTYLRWSRRKWVGEVATGHLPDRGADGDQYARSDVRRAVAVALAALPPKQRAVVVLRYFADLTEAQTAAAMDCAVGTVKSQSARALARLRGVPGLAELMTGGVAS